MNTTDKDIEKLTHELLRCSMPEPSPGLANLIMKRIIKETPVVSKPVMKVSIESDLNLPVIIISVIVYLVLFAGALFLWQSQPERSGNILSGLKEAIPYLLIVVAIGGSLLFFSALDNVLFRWKKF